MGRIEEPRTDWNNSIKYRTLDSDTYKNGVMVNMSAKRALLWLAEKYPVGSSLDVLIRTDERLDHIYMRVVRAGETNHTGYTGYGCKVEMTLSEAA